MDVWNPSDLLQIFGSAALTVLAITLWHIGGNHASYGRYGHEALKVTSAMLLASVGVRMLAVLDMITHEEGRVIVGMLGFAALAVLLELVWLRRRTAEVVRQPTRR